MPELYGRGGCRAQGFGAGFGSLQDVSESDDSEGFFGEDLFHDAADISLFHSMTLLVLCLPHMIRSESRLSTAATRETPCEPNNKSAKDQHLNQPLPLSSLQLQQEQEALQQKQTRQQSVGRAQ